MDLVRTVSGGAMLGLTIAMFIGLGEVLGMMAGVLPTYQHGVTLSLVASAIPIYGVVGALAAAILTAALWVVGVRARLRPALAALAGAGWVGVIGAILLSQSVRYQPTTSAVVALLGGGVMVAAVGVGAVLWALERTHARGDLRWLRLAPLAAVTAAVVGLFPTAWLFPVRPSEPSASTLPNVILIVMDTTRADHLSAYGYPRRISPRIDRLASEGARFDSAMAASSWTLPSVASLFTGLPASAHGADHGHWFLDDDRLTLAEILRDRGYATGGFVGGPFCKATFGLAQGFDTYDDALTPPVMNLALVRASAKLLAVESLTRPERRADELNERLLPWLERHAHRPFFLFINYFDPHDPYDPPGEYSRRWARPGGLPGDVERTGLVARVVRGVKPLAETEAEQLLGLYDGEVAFMDDQIGRLVEALDRLNVLDRTLLILTADHGESFGEHQLMTHGNSLYEDQIRVPLILRYPPRIPAGTVVPTPVHALDALPTILDLLEIRAPSALPGRSLVPILNRLPAASERTLVSELRRGETWSRVSPRFNRNLVALRQGEWKFIVSSDGTAELFRLHEDPGELKNRAQEHPELVATFYREALRWLARRDQRGPGPRLDPATREQLKALGY